MVHGPLGSIEHFLGYERAVAERRFYAESSSELYSWTSGTMPIYRTIELAPVSASASRESPAAAATASAEWTVTSQQSSSSRSSAQCTVQRRVIHRARVVVGAVTCDKSCQFFARSHVAMATTEIQQTLFFVHAAFCLLVLRAEGNITEHSCN